MNYFITFFLAIFSVCLCSCFQQTNQDTRITDRQQLMLSVSQLVKLTETTDKKSQIREEIAFWTSKLEKDPAGYIYMDKLGKLYGNLFEHSGRLEHLDMSDVYFQSATDRVSGKFKANMYLSLSANAIKHHDFVNALEYTRRAYDLSPEKYGPILMSFDAEMELGNYLIAGQIMDKYANHDSYDYLVRYAKYLDHSDQLDEAVRTMEKAADLVKYSHPDNYVWTLSCLGDMYGHQGNIRQSYNTYLRVLERDPLNTHVIKGLAWMAYAHDGDTGTAMTILSAVAAVEPMPDAFLMMAEISGSLGDLTTKKVYEERFMSVVDALGLQDMYATYIIDILIDWGKSAQAVDVALQEVDKRPTPVIYDLLAWAFYHNGQPAEARHITQTYVVNKSPEPILLYHSGVILKETGQEGQGNALLHKALDASYELGPVITADIAQRLESGGWANL